MNDIKLYYLRFLALLFFSILFYNSKSQNPFIENKGQLPANVNSKVVLPGGALFIEQDKFTYAFYNQEQLESDAIDLLMRRRIIVESGENLICTGKAFTFDSRKRLQTFLCSAT